MMMNGFGLTAKIIGPTSVSSKKSFVTPGVEHQLEQEITQWL